MSPKISIIVPVYNVEKYLGQCVTSLRRQTMEDIEIILVDDGSPDHCPQMCDEYARLDSRIKVIHKQNEGLGYARNSGLSMVAGEYVTFVDSDDWLELDTFENVFKLAKSKGLDMVRYRRCMASEDGQSVKYSMSQATPVVITGRENMRRMSLEIFDTISKRNHLFPYNVDSAWGGVYRMELIKNNNLRFVSEREYISEDMLFNFLFLQYARNIAFCTQTYYHYRVNPNSLSRTFRIDRLERSADFTIAVDKMMGEYGYSAEEKICAIGYYMSALTSCIIGVMKANLPNKEKKEWYASSMRAMMTVETYKIYSLKRLRMKFRMFHIIAKRNSFWMTFLMVKILSVIK